MRNEQDADSSHEEDALGRLFSASCRALGINRRKTEIRHAAAMERCVFYVIILT